MGGFSSERGHLSKKKKEKPLYLVWEGSLSGFKKHTLTNVRINSVTK